MRQILIIGLMFSCTAFALSPDERSEDVRTLPQKTRLVFKKQVKIPAHYLRVIISENKELKIKCLLVVKEISPNERTISKGELLLNEAKWVGVGWDTVAELEVSVLNAVTTDKITCLVPGPMGQSGAFTVDKFQQEMESETFNVFFPDAVIVEP